MLQGEHSAILLTFIRLPFVIKIFVLSIFEWPFSQVLLLYSDSKKSFANKSVPDQTTLEQQPDQGPFVRFLQSSMITNIISPAHQR